MNLSFIPFIVGVSGSVISAFSSDSQGLIGIVSPMIEIPTPPLTVPTGVWEPVIGSALIAIAYLIFRWTWKEPDLPPLMNLGSAIITVDGPLKVLVFDHMDRNGLLLRAVTYVNHTEYFHNGDALRPSGWLYDLPENLVRDPNYFKDYFIRLSWLVPAGENRVLVNGYPAPWIRFLPDRATASIPITPLPH